MTRTDAGCKAGPTTGDEAAVPRVAREEDFEAIFLEHLPYVEHVVRFIVRRHALDSWDAQDFDAWVKLRLIEGDYAVFRKFRGQSKLTTFLTTVVHNLHRDFRIRRWGKWRPSAAAKRLGESGVQLETLLYRDGYSLTEAVRLLRENYEAESTTEELERMAAELRPRFSRRFESEESLLDAVAAERADTRVLEGENVARVSGLLERLQLAMAELDSEDRVILRMRFEDGLSIAAIARELGLDQRRLRAGGPREDETPPSPRQPPETGTTDRGGWS
jgi:RNA polymerase sigma factor for flagellar operon FliA